MARLDILVDPKSGQRRQVVRGGRDQSGLRIILVWTEIALLVTLEIKQPVAEDAKAGQGFADLRLDGAEIFTNDNHLPAHAFERQDSDVVLVAVADVGAASGVRAVGDPVEPEKAHHVIEP